MGREWKGNRGWEGEKGETKGGEGREGTHKVWFTRPYTKS